MVYTVGLWRITLTLGRWSMTSANTILHTASEIQGRECTSDYVIGLRVDNEDCVFASTGQGEAALVPTCS